MHNERYKNHLAHPSRNWQNPITPNVREAQSLFYQAKRFIIFAGAGMSAEIGTPVYWEGEDKKYGSKISAEGYTDYEHAHATLWEHDRDAQIRHYANNLKQMVCNDVMQEGSPYETLLKFLVDRNKDYFIATSNVDGAFVRAGFDENKIYEVHGSRLRSQCLERPHQHGVFTTDLASGEPTLCPTCKGDTRPNCYFFADFEFNAKITSQQRTNFHIFRETLSEGTIGLVIGVGTTVPTIHDQSIMTNFAYDIPLIRINPVKAPKTLSENLYNTESTAPIIDITEKASSGLNSITNIIKY